MTISDTPLANAISSVSSLNGGTRMPRLPDAIVDLGTSLERLDERLLYLYDKLVPILASENDVPDGEDPGKTVASTSTLHDAIVRKIDMIERMANELDRVITRVDL